MSGTIEIRLPDIGDFSEVEVIEVHVGPGDTVQAEDPLITVESDKAAMEVPAPSAGVLREVSVKVGDRVSEGSVIGLLQPATDEEPDKESDEAPGSESDPGGSGRGGDAGPPVGGASSPAGSSGQAPSPAAASYEGEVAFETELLVLGAGPGGYPAAFRAADLGLEVTLVERWATLGGVCLNVGCIPSKALLHAARVIDEAAEMADCGLRFGQPEVDLDGLRGWKDKVVGKLTGGLAQLARQRKVRVVRGTGRFLSAHHLEVVDEGTRQVIAFRQCVIAAGSEPVRLPGLPEDPRIIDSTGALELERIPERLLIIGGGIIGLEMATVYAALGSRVSVVELTEQLMPGCDADLVRPLHKRIGARYEQIMLGTKVSGIESTADGLVVTFGGQFSGTQSFDAVLLSVGRSPNGGRLDAHRAGVRVDERGFIPVDRQMRTNVSHIFAVGDIVGQPMLAHKANHEGRVAAEVAAGHRSAFDARVIPSVAYTDPEVAWVGLTENEARAQGLAYGKGVFPWAASGRSLGHNRDEGITKLLFDEKTHRVLGGGIVGPNAGELVGEVALAIEMGADAADIGLTIHPHPTLSETVAFAAEAFEGTLVDLYLPKKKAAR
ncbi:MAG: dihydrolipoyl dehydrogenase [Chromatiales bacterium]|nr:dihydrolipoyl dehydrogenase [Chromatiales bacterium]